MVVCHKARSLKYLVISSKFKASNETKLKASACTTKKKGNEIYLGVKDRANDIVAEVEVSENVMCRLNSILALDGKTVGQTHT